MRTAVNAPRAVPVAAEHDEQTALIEWAAFESGRHPALHLLYAVPNGGDRHPAVAGELRAEGVRRGVPDLCLPFPCRGYRGLYVEMKRRRNGRLSREQEAWIAALRAVGYRVEVCNGWDAARAVILAYVSAAQPLELVAADALRALASVQTKSAVKRRRHRRLRPAIRRFSRGIRWRA